MRDGCFDGVDALGYRFGSDDYEAKAEVAIDIFVDFFETKAFFKRDAASVGGRDEAEVLDEEYLRFEDGFFFDAIEFSS